MKITPARACSDGGEIVKFGLVRQPLATEFIYFFLANIELL